MSVIFREKSGKEYTSLHDVVRVEEFDGYYEIEMGAKSPLSGSILELHKNKIEFLNIGA